jgi:hypothetical protein
MKAIASALLLLVGPAVLAGDAAIEVFTAEGENRSVRYDADLGDKIQKVVESASVDSTPFEDMKARWERALAAPTRIHATYDPPRRMQVWLAHEPGQADVSEVLIAIEGRFAKHILRGLLSTHCAAYPDD